MRKRRYLVQNMKKLKNNGSHLIALLKIKYLECD